MSFPVSKSKQVKMKKNRGAKVKSFKPQITSLMDVMTILLVFLVKSFSAEGNVMNIPKDVELPVSSAKKAPKPMVAISISNNYLVFDDEYIAPVKEVLNSPELMIDPLFAKLEERKEMTEKIAEFSTKTEFMGNVTIQGDKKIPFKILQKIMFTCGQVGYNNFSLAVLQEE